MSLSVAIAFAGIGVAYLFYFVSPGLPVFLAWKAQRLYQLVLNKYYVDELYEALFVQPTVAFSIFCGASSTRP